MKLLNSSLLITYVIFTVLSLSGCFDEPNGESYKPDYDIFLSVEEVSCLSASLRLTVLGDSAGLKEYSITRNNVEICRDSLYGNDTLIIDAGLEVNSSYSYRAYILTGNTVIDSSDEVLVHTLSTTSHDFVWEIDTLGGNPSTLHDVAIIDENDIWAVGDIRAAGGPYNAAHWNGEKWELIKIPVDDFGSIGTYPLRTICAFSKDEIYFNAGAALVKWDGNSFSQEAFFMASIDDPYYGPINSMWGNSIRDFYSVGDKGYIVHYNGTTWKRMNSGTDIDLRDISGIGEHVFVVGRNYSGENIVIELRNGQWETLFQPDYPKEKITAVDVYDEIVYFITDSGILKYNPKKNQSSFDEVLGIKNWLYRYIDVQNINDIFLLSGDGRTLHFNGVSWHESKQIDLPDIVFYLGNLGFKNDLVIAVGSLSHGGAIIAKGRRY